MPPLQIVERRVGPVTFLTLKGRIVLEEGEAEVRGQIDGLIQEGRLDVVLDLHDVTYIDSCGIGALVAKCVSLRKAGGDLTLLCPSNRCRRMLEVTGLLEAVFDVYESDEAALADITARHSTSA
jgi:anti-sigma B factor antagonist